MHRVAPEQAHGLAQFLVQELEQTQDSLLAPGSQRPKQRFAHQHRFGPQANRLDDISTPANSSIHKYFRPVCNRR